MVDNKNDIACPWHSSFSSVPSYPNIDFLFGAVKKHWGTLHGYRPWKIHFSWGFYSSHSTGFYIKKTSAEKVKEILEGLLEETRGEIENLETVNEEYDEAFAKIGKDEKTSKDEQTTLGDE